MKNRAGQWKKTEIEGSGGKNVRCPSRWQLKFHFQEKRSCKFRLLECLLFTDSCIRRRLFFAPHPAPPPAPLPHRHPTPPSMLGKLSPVSRHAGGVFFLLRALTVGLFRGSHLSHAGTPQIQVLVVCGRARHFSLGVLRWRHALCPPSRWREKDCRKAFSVEDSTYWSFVLFYPPPPLFSPTSLLGFVRSTPHPHLFPPSLFF